MKLFNDMEATLSLEGFALYADIEKALRPILQDRLDKEASIPELLLVLNTFCYNFLHDAVAQIDIGESEDGP